MRQYEYVLVVHPDLDEHAFKELVDKVTGWITTAGGQVLKVESWGKRKLAYPIRKQREAHYVQIDALLAPARNPEMERNFRYLEPVLRYLIVAK
jgi:small subunit ribosomal protein S6